MNKEQPDPTQDFHIVMPAALHKRFKIACVRDGYKSMKPVAVEIVKNYVEWSEEQERASKEPKRKENQP